VQEKEITAAGRAFIESISDFEGRRHAAFSSRLNMMKTMNSLNQKLAESPPLTRAEVAAEREDQVANSITDIQIGVTSEQPEQSDKYIEEDRAVASGRPGIVGLFPGRSLVPGLSCEGRGKNIIFRGGGGWF
jgi:hypothetical protein